MQRLLAAACAAAAMLAGLPAAAAGQMPDCTDRPEPRTILSGFGRLEAIIADRQGRLYFVETGSVGRLYRLSAPGAQPEVLVDEIPNPRGLAFDRRGTLYLGFGGDGVVSSVMPSAGILRVDPDTGEHSLHADGLTMANGVAWGPDGAIYASNSFGTQIHRVLNGEVQLGWASVISANGLVVDRAGEFLYAAQTFQPAAIKRVEIANPEHVETWFQAGPADIAGGPDGIARDDEDTLYVAANGAGQVWRIDQRRRACVLWRGLPFPLGPSAVAVGSGQRLFPAENLYVVNFRGEVIELPGVS